jgi:hypothetical protein
MEGDTQSPLPASLDQDIKRCPLALLRPRDDLIVPVYPRVCIFPWHG